MHGVVNQSSVAFNLLKRLGWTGGVFLVPSRRNECVGGAGFA